MTRPWKLKTTSSNILLVLITLILVKAEWTTGEKNNSVESSIGEENPKDETHIYVGNDEIAEYFFHSSINNSSLILEGINKCLDSFQLITCVKMLLLNRINDAMILMKKSDFMQKDVRLLNGLLEFKIKGEAMSSGPADENSDLSLDEEIAFKVKRMFYKRTLLVNLLRSFKIEIEPTPGKKLNDLICLTYKVQKEPELENRGNVEGNEGRKRKGGGMSMMMIGPLIMMGLMPFTLASLKAMVMNAVMINMMALNGAIFMTIRNLVFGPRQGDNVKYVNYGYSKDRQTQSKRPVLIIHSPAAFVKQPPVHKKRVHGHSSYRGVQNYFSKNHNSYTGSSNLYHYQNTENDEDYEDGYYSGEGYIYHGQGQDIEKRNEIGLWNRYYKANATRQTPHNLKTSNQRIYTKQGWSQKPKFSNSQSIPSFVQTNLVNSKAKPNTDSIGGNIEGIKPHSREHTFRQQNEAEKKKLEFKPSPQWDSVADTDTVQKT